MTTGITSIIGTFEDRNPSFYWLDKYTFCLSFDGGIDEDGDEYSYLVEYHKDVDSFIFVKWYEDDNMYADFTTEEMEFLKKEMSKRIEGE